MKKLVIFGVGLIGGSIALALKKNMKELQVVGLGRAGESLQTALELGVIDLAETDTASALMHADMVIIATPVAQTPPILLAIAPYLDKKTVVTDVGSTKADVMAHARALLGEKISQFVPGHPIAGAEKSGVTAARADLFDNKNVVLTPTAETNPLALEQVRQMWLKANAQVSLMSADEHDGIFAAVSHLPHLLAFALVDDIAARPNASQLFSFAASGFRDFTRIAGSNAEMWRDISLANKNALLNELTTYQAEISRLYSLLQNEDAAGLQALFERASVARNAWAESKIVK
ncbi:MAG: prephenate dehydrogenase/arogenate dehydrogenase family protein [Methylophilaceae bacterium]|nr:prephenate dehydrogenase/arogenate dehydrogenase family protein [Methylophilaceae bacterium]